MSLSEPRMTETRVTMPVPVPVYQTPENIFAGVPWAYRKTRGCGLVPASPHRSNSEVIEPHVCGGCSDETYYYVIRVLSRSDFPWRSLRADQWANLELWVDRSGDDRVRSGSGPPVRPRRRNAPPTFPSRGGNQTPTDRMCVGGVCVVTVSGENQS